MKINSFLVTLTLFLSINLSTSAQHRVGIIGGINFSTMSANVDDIERDVKNLTKIGIGAVLELGVTDNFSIAFEPMYLQKGGLVEEIVSDPEVTADLQYIELPLLFKVTVGKSIKPFLFAGPTVGFLLASDMTAAAGALELSGNPESILKSFDFGFAFGAGIYYPIWKGNLLLECRYTLGITDISREGNAEISNGPAVAEISLMADDEIKNKGFQVFVGYTFPFNF